MSDTSTEPDTRELIVREIDANGVRRITLNRPDKRNAITRDMFAELTDAFRREPPSDERVTVIDAVGTVFCAGVDLGQRTEGGDAEGASPLELLCAAVHDYPLPVVAVLQGSAIGGGAMLALHCDFVVASTEARLGNAAVQMGLVPAWPVARAIRDVSGPARAAQLLLLGDLVPAGQLADAFIISRAVEPDDLEATAGAIIARLAANAPLSLRAIKATLTAVDHGEIGHDSALRLIRAAQSSEDAREGVLARKEKRPARYQGR
jgi:enoyl-CoA hydratase/carnithine racemase